MIWEEGFEEEVDRDELYNKLKERGCDVKRWTLKNPQVGCTAFGIVENLPDSLHMLSIVEK